MEVSYTCLIENRHFVYFMTTRGADPVDAYEVLGITPSASNAEVRAAYLKLVRLVRNSSYSLMQHHPDKTGGDAIMDVRIRQINEAYETLRDDMRRTAHDAKHKTRVWSAPRISDVIDLDAFEASDTIDGIVFSYPCRCGQHYTLAAAQLVQGAKHVACVGCSEMIEVAWES